MKLAFDFIYEKFPVILLIWLFFSLIINDYLKASYLVVTLGIWIIDDRLGDINENLSRISQNTDLTSKTIVFTQSTKKTDEPE